MTLFAQSDKVFLPVRNIEKTTRWYHEKLGWLLALKKVKVTLSMVGDAAINLYTHDIQTTHTILKENGVDVSDIHDCGSSKDFYFKDLEGNRISIYSC